MTKQKFGPRSNSKGNYQPESTIKNESFGIRTVHTKLKSEVSYKIEEVKRNKEMLDTYKIKEK